MAVRDPLQPAVPGRELSADPTPAEAAVDRSGDEMLARLIGLSLCRPELLAEALTHPSALAAAPSRPRHEARAPRRRARNYERLEFLGDRVLGLVVADLLWRRFATEPEGASDPAARRNWCARETWRESPTRSGSARYLQLSPSESGRRRGRATRGSSPMPAKR